MATYTLHIVSDATGSLAAHFVRAILTQFPGVTFRKVYHTFRDTPDKVARTAATFKRGRQLVVHALVNPDSKKLIHDACARLKVPHYDLTGSLVQFISDHLRLPPVNELSRLHEVNAGYFRRIEAMEFTAAHDDGQGLATLKDADLVLVGLSRVSKSPTCTYLGAMGFKTANVPVTPQTGFPRELDRVKRKVVALTLQPRRLQEIRANRLRDAGVGETTSYSEPRAVIQEIVWAEKEFRARGYPIVDITDMTIERTAATILKLKGLERPDHAMV